MKQLENEILRVRNDSEQIKKETEQLKLENSRLAKLNARERALSALIKRHCFPPESSSNHPQPTEPDCGPSLP
jgi:DNA repair ATPase RecN